MIKITILRIVCVIVASAVYVSFFTYKTQNNQHENCNEGVVSASVPTRKVKVKVKHEHTEDNINAVQEEMTEYSNPELNSLAEIISDSEENNNQGLHQEIIEQTGTAEKEETEIIIPVPAPDNESINYIGSYIDADNINSQYLIMPVIDINKIYSKIVYPASMIRKNIECSFNIRVLIDSTGAVSIIIPENVEKAFADSVRKAFRGITAVPATLKGIPTDVCFTIPFTFSLL